MEEEDEGPQSLRCTWDPIHRKFNDAKQSAMHAGFQDTVSKIMFAMNANHGPFMSGQVRHQSQEGLKALLQLDGANHDIWEELREDLAFDQGKEPSEMPSLVSDAFLDANTFEVAGPFVEMRRFFSWHTRFRSCRSLRHRPGPREEGLGCGEEGRTETGGVTGGLRGGRLGGGSRDLRSGPAQRATLPQGLVNGYSTNGYFGQRTSEPNRRGQRCSAGKGP